MPKIAFWTHHGYFKFTVISIGLYNIPTTFLDIINQVFKPYLDMFTIVFNDDILFYSKNKKEHVIHLWIGC